MPARRPAGRTEGGKRQFGREWQARQRSRRSRAAGQGARRATLQFSPCTGHTRILAAAARRIVAPCPSSPSSLSDPAGPHVEGVRVVFPEPREQRAHRHLVAPARLEPRLHARRVQHVPPDRLHVAGRAGHPLAAVEVGALGLACGGGKGEVNREAWRGSAGKDAAVRRAPFPSTRPTAPLDPRQGPRKTETKISCDAPWKLNWLLSF